MKRNLGPDVSPFNTFEKFDDMTRTKIILSKVLNRQTQIISIDQFPKGTDMLGMQKAVDIFISAVSAEKKIKFICDSDTDGLCTFILWWNFFKVFPYRNIELVITDRREGYGFIPKHIDESVDLYITSDNGITSIEATALAKAHGAEIIITDHHQPDLEKGLPDADAIIDPYQPGCTFPYKDISGTFVLWFYLHELIKWYKLDIDPFNEYIYELGLTTVSDVMPLDRHINRFVVKEMMKRLQNPKEIHRQYIKTFITEGQTDSRVSAENLAFGLIPALNATQRITTPEHGATFLTQETKEKSKEWFEFIRGVNDTRKERQQVVYKYIDQYYKEWIDRPFIIIPGEFQPQDKGVLGIIAGKLAEKYNKPALVLSKNNQGYYSGSGRSSGDLDILKLVKGNKHVQMANGHKQALGVEIKEKDLLNFASELYEESVKIPQEVLQPKKLPLGYINFHELHLDMFYELREYEPFGKNFPRPTFVTQALVKSARLVGKDKNHLTIVLTDLNRKVELKGIKFFTEESPKRGDNVLIYFNLDEDTYGKIPKLSLRITKLEQVESPKQYDLKTIFHGVDQRSSLKDI